MNNLSDKYTVANNLTTDQFDQLHGLYQQMWWSKDRTKEEVTILLRNCIIIGVIDNDTNALAGFARVLTDELRYAFIFDVMTPEHLRGIGLGKMIMNTILTHQSLQKVKYFELTCAPELADYYRMFGFCEDYESVIAMRYTNKGNL